MAKRTYERYGFLLGLVALALFKLWVVHTEEIYGSSTVYDALWYVGSAKHWYWGAPYSWTAFVRPCAYPLFIAVMHFCGVPLRIAIELMQMAGCAVLIAAFRKAGVSRLLCVLIFAAMILHPATLTFNNDSMSDSFYTAILPLALGGSLLTLLTRKFIHAAWTGIPFAVLWNTREESFLIPVALAVVLGLALLQGRTNAFYRKVARQINRACDEGRIPSRRVLSSFLDPGAVARLYLVPGSILRIAKLFLFRHQKRMVRDDTNLEPWMRSLYEEMVFRRPPNPDGSNEVVIPDTISDKLAVAVQSAIRAYYVYFFVGLAWAGLAAFLFMLCFFRRLRVSDPGITILVLLGATVVTRLLFFSFLDATWWMAGYERYLFPVMPLTSCSFLLLIYQAFARWRSRHVSSSPAHT